MKRKMVTLYSVETVLSRSVEMISVQAEETLKTYRLAARKGGGFRYSSVIRKVEFLTRGIAFSRAAAIDMFIAARQRTIEKLQAQIDCKKQEILDAEKLRGEA